MNLPDFEQMLAAQGFAAPVRVEREALGALGEHTHPFEAKAVILSGEIRIDAAGVSSTYRAGDIFHLGAEVPHSEFYGPQGVVYLVGRKGR